MTPGSPEHFARYLELTGIIFDKTRLLRDMQRLGNATMALDAAQAIASAKAALLAEFPEMVEGEKP